MKKRKLLVGVLSACFISTSAVALMGCEQELKTFDYARFEDTTYLYDGLEKSLEVSGAPRVATITYSPDNTYTDVGEYEITATLSADGYETLNLTATLTIEYSEQYLLKSQVETLILALETAITTNKTNAENQIASLTAEYQAEAAELEQSITTNSTAISSLQTAYNAKVKELEDTAKANKETLETALATAKTELQGSITALDDKYKAEVKELEDTYKADKQSLENTIATINQQILDTNSNLSSLQTSYNAKVQELENALNTNKEELQAEISELNDEITSTNETLNALQTVYSAKVQELAQADKKLQEDLADLTTALETAKTNVANEIARLESEYETAIETLENSLAQATSELKTETNAKIATLQTAIDTASAQITANKTELENKITALQTATNTKISEIEALIATVQATDTTQNEKIAELLERIVEIENELANKHEHSFGEWVVYSAKEVPCQDKIFYHICSTCNTLEWKTGVYSEHALEEDYSYDEEYHWLTCKNCNEIIDKQAHTLIDSGECSVCLEWIKPTEGVEYALSSNGTYAEVVGYTGTASRVRIAETYQNVPVTHIAQGAFESKSNVTAVALPSSITSIGERAFINCSNLKKVYISDLTAWCNMDFDVKSNPLFNEADLYLNGELVTELVIPESVTEIKPLAFECCKSLTSVTIHDNVTSIGEGAFWGCYNLTKIHIADLTAWCNIDFGEYSAFEGQNDMGLYLDNELITELVIPESITEIKPYAFHGVKGLTSVTIHDNVTSIGDYAFGNGSISLTKVYITDLTAWCNIDFGGSNNLSTSNPLVYGADLYLDGEIVTELVIPESVTQIKPYAFYNCESLMSVTIHENVTSIGNYAFYNCYKLAEVVNYSPSITVGQNTSNGYVGYYAIAIYNSGDEYEDKLSNEDGYVIYTNGTEKVLVGYTGTATDLALPSGITAINQYAFYRDKNLTSVTIPASVTSIGSSAFYGCSNLKKVYITDLTAWCNITFSGSSSNPLYNGAELCLKGEPVTELVIPNDITEIKAYAFYKYESLTSVVIPASVTSIGNNAFYNCYKLAEVVNKSTRITIGNDNKNGYVGYYAVAIYNGRDVYEDRFSTENGYVIYTNGTEKVLVGYTGTATDLVLPSDITAIRQYAFYGDKNITSVTLPTSVTSIGSYAFSGCSNLKKVYIRDLTAWCNIDFGTTSSNPLYDGAELYLNDELVTELVIPDDITQIKPYAFYNCESLTSVTIHENVTSIGSSAFSGCYNLKKVYIRDLTAWCNIDFGTTSSNPLYNGAELYLNNEPVTELVIPESITQIKAYAFYKYESLTCVTIHDKVTSIGTNAFYGCSYVTKVYYKGSVVDWAKMSSSSNFTSATVYYYSESEPALNSDGTAYDGNYWRYVDGVATAWVYTEE